jgi:hypothetical protein
LWSGHAVRQSPTAGEIRKFRRISLEEVNRMTNHSNQGCSPEKVGTMIAAGKSGGAERLEKSGGFS